MKTRILSIALLATAMSFSSCSERKQEKAEAATEEALDDAGEALDNAGEKIDSTADRIGDKIEDAVTKEKTTVTGKVTDVANGKDGYTATIEAADGNKYAATISIPNLDDPKQYRAVNKGETITVSGELMKSGGGNLIKVEKLQ